MDTTHEKVLSHIDQEWVAEQTLALVETPSVTMDEAEVCAQYADLMAGIGLDVDVREVTPGRNNLYARIPGLGDGPALVFNGHLDTIPIGNCVAPGRNGDTITGRGSTDMKGGMVSLLGAAKAILESGVKLRGDVWVTAVVGHEEPVADKDGPNAMIQDLKDGRLAGDRIVIVEGRDALWVMSMGSMVWTIELTSPKGGTHTQYVPFSENPIRFVGDLIQRIHQRQIELDEGDVHPLAGAERIDVGIVEAGDYFNRTPVTCKLTGTRRWSPGRTADGCLTELETLAADFAHEGGLDLRVSMVHEREPFETPVSDPSAQAIAQAHRDVAGAEPEYVGLRIVGDANLYVHGTGIPTFYYGPSNETAHADDECVSVQRLGDAARVYALGAMRYCGAAES
jgi:acetylornithine deacetylase/succinyl-diaminopimelate desuccinylase-like protein